MRNLGTCAALILAGVILGGCINVDTGGWQRVASDYKDAYRPTNVEKDRAVQAAREAAIENGLTKRELGDYDIDADYKGDVWWVDFHREDSKGRFWPDRFTVRVDQKGRTVLFRDPAGAPRH